MSVTEKYKLKINGDQKEANKSHLTGLEVMHLVNVADPAEHVLYLLLENGDMESIRPTEIVDLNRSGIEEFRLFKSDVIYKIEVNGEAREWAAPHITGRAIKRLAGVVPDDVGIWQEVKGQDDRLIEDHDKVDLSHKGVERFRVGHKYRICIEDHTYEWPKSTITTEELIQLAGWEPTQQVVEVEPDQSERTLQPGEVIRLKPGQAFCKHNKFKRGFNDPRIEAEHNLLKTGFPNVTYAEASGLHWFLIDDYPLPDPLTPSKTRIAFSVSFGHPTPAPYGFYICEDIRHNGNSIPAGDVPNTPPFPGTWKMISWTPENWNPGYDVSSGSNLWSWARSFQQRLMEGV